jgi:hypothetical protein
MEPDLRSRISLRSIQAAKLPNGEARVTDERKAGPTPALSFDRTGFALHVTVFCRRAKHSLSRAKENSGAETRRENEGVCHEIPARLARRTPSPRRGEGWGEGFGSLSFCSEVRTPSTCPSPLRGEGTQLAGCDTPLSARRLSRARHDAPRDERACIPDGATRTLHFSGRPLHMIRRSRDATRAQ